MKDSSCKVMSSLKKCVDTGCQDSINSQTRRYDGKIYNSNFLLVVLRKKNCLISYALSSPFASKKNQPKFHLHIHLKRSSKPHLLVGNSIENLYIGIVIKTFSFYSDVVRFGRNAVAPLFIIVKRNGFFGCYYRGISKRRR